jgi:hypothetical protein
MFIIVLFIIAKLWKQPRCSKTHEWIKKMWYIYTMEYNSVTKNKIMLFAGKWMGKDIIMLSKVCWAQDKIACFPSYVEIGSMHVNT